jgi:hypothetical protein
MPLVGYSALVVCHDYAPQINQAFSWDASDANPKHKINHGLKANEGWREPTPRTAKITGALIFWRDHHCYFEPRPKRCSWRLTPTTRRFDLWKPTLTRPVATPEPVPPRGIAPSPPRPGQTSLGHIILSNFLRSKREIRGLSCLRYRRGGWLFCSS